MTVFLFPNVFWLVLTMGAFLSIFVCFGGTFAGTLVAPPYDWSYSSVGFVFAGQIIVSLVVVPVQGYLSDYLITYLSKRNNGISEVGVFSLNLALDFQLTRGFYSRNIVSSL